jgi:hypothetical protein
MQRSKSSLILWFVSTLVILFGHLTALAQETQNEKEDPASVQMRVLCSQTVDGAIDLKIMRDVDLLFDLTLMPAMVSDPLGVGRGELKLYRRQEGVDKSDPILTITIPEIGKRFALVLLPDPGNNPKVPYRHLLIRTDGLKFDASDLYMINFTAVAIGGNLGDSKFVLEPGKSKVVTPKPGGDERMYQAQFYFQHEDKPRMFNDTRWPLAATARVYLFFVPDPVRQSISYVSFREYGPFN